MNPACPHLLRLLHLTSPALPIGAFHFSQGLEYAVQAGWVRDEASTLEWLEGLAEETVATLDLPVLARLHAAWREGDTASVRQWNSFLIAARETEELRAEDRHLGAALRKVLPELGVDPTADWPDEQPVAYATAFALACTRWQIPQADSLQAYAWAWLENQVLAAVKLVPLGQSAGQRILARLTGRLPALVGRALVLQDDDISIAGLMQAIASMRHETQYSRLFRS